MNETSQYVVSDLLEVVFKNYQSGKPVVYFNEVKVSNLKIEAVAAESSGGKKNMSLIMHDTNYSVDFAMTVGKMSLWILEALANGTVKKNELDNITDRVKFKGASKVLPETPIALSVYEIQGTEGNWYITQELDNDEYILNDKEISIVGEDDFSTRSFLVEYVFGAPSTEVTVWEKQTPTLFRIEGKVKMIDAEKKHEIFAHIVIPKVSIMNSFSLLMANLSNEGQTYQLNARALRPMDTETKGEKGLIVLRFVE